MPRASDPEIFLRKLDQSGGSSGNTALMRELGWTADRYWKVRDALLDEGVVSKGRGKGGSVQTNRDVPISPCTDQGATDIGLLSEQRRCLPSRGADSSGVQDFIINKPLNVHCQEEESKSAAGSKQRPVVLRSEGRNGEVDLYVPFANVLKNEWRSERRLTNIEVQVTAFGGKRSTGGTWTRPDITVVSSKSFTVVPQVQFDVWTFELKPVSGIDVKAVFEALSHRRRATRSFVALEVPVQQNERVEALIGRCETEAGIHGIGLILFSDAASFSTWEVRLDAQRKETDGDLLEEFIVEQVDPDVRRRIQSWR